MTELKRNAQRLLQGVADTLAAYELQHDRVPGWLLELSVDDALAWVLAAERIGMALAPRYLLHKEDREREQAANRSIRWPKGG